MDPYSMTDASHNRFLAVIHIMCVLYLCREFIYANCSEWFSTQRTGITNNNNKGSTHKKKRQKNKGEEKHHNEKYAASILMLSIPYKYDEIETTLIHTNTKEINILSATINVRTHEHICTRPI